MLGSARRVLMVGVVRRLMCFVCVMVSTGLQEVKEVEVEQTTTKGRGNRSKSKKPKIPQSLTTGMFERGGVSPRCYDTPCQLR